jgi:hypothetical protein
MAYIYTIEFQKRGLPHAHILLILAPEDKFNSTDDVDAVISAEIPDKETNPMLYETISRDMLHGPCDPTFKDTRCMEDGKCKKRFPNKFSNVTKLAEGPSGGYPEYRRRSDGKVVKKKVISSWITGGLCPTIHTYA